jgi:hypothetical protein
MLKPRLKKMEPVGCLIEFTFFPSPPRQARRNRESDEDQNNLHPVPRTSTEVEELRLHLPPPLASTSISLPSPPRPAREKNEAATHELKKKKPATNSLFKDADAEDPAPCFNRRSQGAAATGPRA